MTFPQYPKYQNSAFEWIGEVPAHWSMSKVRHITQCLDGRRVPLNASERAERPGRVPYWGANTIVDFVDEALFDEELVLLGEDGAPFFDKSKSVAFFSRGKVWPNNHVHVLRPTERGMGQFLTYVLNITDYSQFIDGSTRDKLTQGAMNSIPIPLPPRVEQASIVDFLDGETAKIEELIVEQRRLLELLKEKRHAVIARAVTQGINPHVAMKPSGIEWLGDIPAHWRVERGRLLFKKLDIPPSPEDDVVTAFRDGQVTLRSNRRTEGFTMAVLEGGYQRVRIGDLVIHGMDAFAGAIGVSESTGKCTPEYSVLTPASQGINNYYFANILRLMALRNFVFVICPSVRERAPRFRFEAFKDVRLPVPPLEEQVAIIQALKTREDETTALAAEAQRAISLLQERRAALISAVVTGKIDVRAVVERRSA